MVGNIMLGMVKFMPYHIQIMETYHNDWTHANSSYNGMYDSVYIYIYRFGYIGKHVYIYMIWLIIWLYLKNGCELLMVNPKVNHLMGFSGISSE